MYTTLENAHFNMFREHMMGQPIKGDKDMLHEITVDDLRGNYNSNYYGDNLVFVATGNVNHEQVVDAVDQHFNTLPK